MTDLQPDHQPGPISTPQPPTLRRLLLGDDGLRAGWSFLLFLLLAGPLSFGAATLAHRLHLLTPQSNDQAHAPMTVATSLVTEIIGIVGFGLAALIMARVERRPFSRFGLSLRRSLPDFVTGLFWGLLALTVLVATLFFSHHLVFDQLLLTPLAAIVFGLRWLLVFFAVGVQEEFTTRGYIQYTVSRGVAGIARALDPCARHAHAIGFWVAAFLFSVLLFMAGHLGNPGETLPGILAVGLAGAVFALSLYRTGTLWWAIGFHTAWDWAQSFLYGVPDSGLMTRQHLLATHPQGSPLISGGSTGPEGSILVLPTFLLVALVIHLTLHRRTYPLTPDQTPEPSRAQHLDSTSAHEPLRPKLP